MNDHSTSRHSRASVLGGTLRRLQWDDTAIFTSALSDECALLTLGTSALSALLILTPPS